MHPCVVAVMFVWFVAVTVIGGATFIAAVSSWFALSNRQHESNVMGIVMPPLVLALGVALVHAGRSFARDEGQFLRDFLIKTLDARAVDPVA
jgi:ABC-type Mn2+/Zn2+ transport system permease subunit